MMGDVVVATKGSRGGSRARRAWRARLVALTMVLASSACRPAPDPEARYDPGALRFAGDEALATLTDFVHRFPHRHSGAPNNRRAARWLEGELTGLGLVCERDEWRIVNYSRPVDLHNVICRLPGESGREVVVVAHHDQSPRTVYGADNDGSGIAILLELARIFACEPAPRHTLVFLSADAEEYGMIGTRHFVRTHAAPRRIVAGISLDNLGKRWSVGLEMSPIGQFRGYGSLWLLKTARAAAAAADGQWVPRIPSPVEQVLGQTVPISFMDQGPLVAAGVPALGFATRYAPEARDSVWQTYHSPEDRVEYQSAAVLHQSGRAAEALIRELLAREETPAESGPYLYFEDRDAVLRGAPLWLLFVGFVAVFVVGGAWVGGRPSRAKLEAWRAALPHLLSLWIPLFASVLLLYLLLVVGLLDRYHVYPATARDPAIFEPRWPAVSLYLAGLAALLAAGRRAAAAVDRRGRLQGQRAAEPTVAERRSLALVAVGLAAAYILVINPFSLVFLVPVAGWFALGGRRGMGRAADVGLLLAGGLVVYVLLHYFGFVVLRNDFAVLWYLMMMFSIGMIGWPTALAISGVIAAGLSLAVAPPRAGAAAGAPPERDPGVGHSSATARAGASMSQ